MPRMLKAKEAAEYLGVHVETLRHLAKRGEFPGFKVGKIWRFNESTLKRWEKTHQQRLKQPHVLVVDDDDIILRFAQQVLGPEGYRVSAVPDGIQALELIRRELPDVVLLDLNMPGMNGPTLLKEIRKSAGNLPVIIITDYPHTNLMAEALQYGPILVLPKPLEPKRLFDTLDLALSGSKTKDLSFESK